MTLQGQGHHPRLSIHVQLLEHAKDLGLPSYATEEAAGLDLTAAVTETITLQPGERRLVPTGIAIALPPGYEAQIRPRSGLALKHGLTTLNTPGTIDSDYRGEIGVILINHGQEAYEITRGMRIAQMVVTSYTTIEWQPVVALPASLRGTGGFGSTGVGHPLQNPQEKASDQ
ncbi:MAG: dUTP diphosphatase [Pseudomonadota bacterium]